ncbi:hypothetical protein STEG23_007730 [Scotinomys teguina]
MVEGKENDSSLSKKRSSLTVMKSKTEEKSDVGSDFRGGKTSRAFSLKMADGSRHVKKGYISSGKQDTLVIGIITICPNGGAFHTGKTLSHRKGSYQELKTL